MINISKDLKNKYVAFLDVMGFKDLVNGKQNGRLQEYFNEITSVLNKLRIDKEDIESLMINDSIILCKSHSN